MSGIEHRTTLSSDGRGCSSVSRRGLLRRIEPDARIIWTAFVLAGMGVSRAETPAGLALVALLLIATIAATAPSPLHLRRVLTWGLLVYAPLLPLSWLQDPQTSQAVLTSPGLVPLHLAPAWNAAVKGYASTVVLVSGVLTLSLSDMYDAVERLRVPLLLKQLLIQITLQASMVRTETQSILRAMRIRGAAQGMRLAVHFVRTFPVVWVMRMQATSDRVYLAMEARRYAGVLPQFTRSTWGTREWAVVGSGVLMFTGAILTRSFIG